MHELTPRAAAALQTPEAAAILFAAQVESRCHGLNFSVPAEAFFALVSAYKKRGLIQLGTFGLLDSRRLRGLLRDRRKFTYTNVSFGKHSLIIAWDTKASKGRLTFRYIDEPTTQKQLRDWPYTKLPRYTIELSPHIKPRDLTSTELRQARADNAKDPPRTGRTYKLTAEQRQKDHL